MFGRCHRECGEDANSAIRFTTLSTLKQFVQGSARPGQQLPSAITFGIGVVAGLVTVYTTMPLEYVSIVGWGHRLHRLRERSQTHWSQCPVEHVVDV